MKRLSTGVWTSEDAMSVFSGIEAGYNGQLLLIHYHLLQPYKIN
jgi:hypothetical protein